MQFLILELLYPLGNAEHVRAGVDLEVLNISTPTSFTGGGKRSCWTVCLQECEVHGSSVREWLKSSLAFWKELLYMRISVL